jgi:nicotinamide-nucleotide amidase
MTDLTPLHRDVSQLIDRCRRENLKIATAESCTGGLLAGAITEVPGASHVFGWGVVTYANSAKIELLGVPRELIDKHGAVSEEVAIAMAEGALARSGADVAVAVTGIAGPDGGTEQKPVGLVYLASARKGRPTLKASHHFADFGRDSARFAAVQQAIRMLMQRAAS